MANPKHLDMLKQGVDAWKNWRRENPTQRPDLSGVELAGANLYRVDLSHAKLNDTNLNKANLREADLTGAILYRADLGETVLTKAKLIKANLRRADLIGAKLHRCDLRKADLGKADLFGADLSEVDLRGASLTASNLSSAIITGARLYGTVRDDWRLDNIICDYIYWDARIQQRMPPEGKFDAHEFESIYERLPSPGAHFTRSVAVRGQTNTLILRGKTGSDMSTLTPDVLSTAILPYLSALADLQRLVNEFSDKPNPRVAIVSISHQKHTVAEISGAGPLLALIRDAIVPWRRRYAGEVSKVNRAITRARIILREAEILKLRSGTENNTVEAKMLDAEASKKYTEANLLHQKASEIRQQIYNEIEADLLRLLPVESMPKKRLAQFKNRSTVPMRVLAESDLAD